MDTVVVTILSDEKTVEDVDLALPASVPFAQLAQILIEKLEWRHLSPLAASEAWAGLLPSGLMVRPQETLSARGVADGDSLKLIPIPKSDFTFSGEVTSPGYGARLQSVMTGKVFSIRGRQVVVGRSRHHLVNLSDLPDGDIVSRKHATISRRQDEFWIQDEGSSNGTFVNGRMLQDREMVLIRDGCQIQFGKDGPILVFYAS